MPTNLKSSVLEMHYSLATVNLYINSQPSNCIISFEMSEAISTSLLRRVRVGPVPPQFNISMDEWIDSHSSTHMHNQLLPQLFNQEASCSYSSYSRNKET